MLHALLAMVESVDCYMGTPPPLLLPGGKRRHPGLTAIMIPDAKAITPVLRDGLSCKSGANRCIARARAKATIVIEHSIHCEYIHRTVC